MPETMLSSVHLQQQDHLALGILNGHNAMVAGTYKHALGRTLAYSLRLYHILVCLLVEWEK